MKYLYYIKKFKSLFFLVLIVAIISIGCEILMPNITSYFIDALSLGNSSFVINLVAFFFIIYLINFLLRLILAFLSQKCAWKITDYIRQNIIKHILKLDVSFYKAHTHGELLERIEGDISHVFEIYSSILISLVSNALLLLGILVCLFLINKFIFLIFALYSLISLFLLKNIHNANEEKWLQLRVANASINGFYSELINNAAFIKISKYCQFYLKKLNDIFKSNKKVIINANKTWATISNLTDILFVVGTILSFVMIIYLYSNGNISIGKGYLIFNYVQILRRPLEQIRLTLQSFQASGAAFERIDSLLKIKSNVIFGTQNILTENSVIEVKDLNFKYNIDEKDILTNIHFKLEQGMKLGIIGRTGSGKSTLINLLVHFFTAENDQIFINNLDINSISEESLYNYLIFVTQDVFMINGTLRDNLTLFNKTIKDEELHRFLKDLHLLPFLSRFENGLEEFINVEGDNYSQSNAQIINFIRAVMRGGHIYIFDEITAKLSGDDEKLILNAIDIICDNAICIFISHKRKSIENMSHLLVLENGKQLCFDESNKVLMEFDLENYLKKN